jgi:hypothetical protein
MAKQLFLNNFETWFIAPVKDAPTSGTPATELDYGVLRISDGAAGALLNPTDDDFYVLTAYKRSGTTETAIEIMRVTDVDNATPGECRITVLRAQEGTPAQAYVSGDHLALRLTKGGVDNFSQVSDASGTPASAIGFTPAGGIAATDVQAALQELDNEKEPAIAAGTASQYQRGDKTWRDFFTDVRAATLTGLSTATNAVIVAADTVLVALGKLQKQITDHFGSGGAAHAVATTGAAGFMAAADKVVLGAVAGAIDGGAVGQVLYKVSLTDFDLGWKTLGTAADKNTGTSGDAVPLLNVANTWSAVQRFNADLGIGIDPLAALHARAVNPGDPTATGTTMTGVSARLQSSSVGLDFGTYASGVCFIQPRLAADHASNFDLFLNPNGGATKVGRAVVFADQFNAGPSGTAKTINFLNGQKQILTLTGNATISFTWPGVGTYQLILAQDATGGRTVTWGGLVLYVGRATAPDINAAANGYTLVTVFWNGSSAWLAASKVNA